MEPLVARAAEVIILKVMYLPLCVQLAPAELKSIMIDWLIHQSALSASKAILH